MNPPADADVDAMERGVSARSTELSEKKPADSRSPTSTTLSGGSLKPFASAASVVNSFQNGVKLVLNRTESFGGGLKSIFNGKESNADEDQLIVRQFKDCPRGYPNLAVFLDSSEEFMIYRRFGYLQSRALLNKQDQLRELEKRLDREDTNDASGDYRLLMSREKDETKDRPRVHLLNEIETCFKEYADLLGAAQTLAAFSKPSKRDYASVRHYHDGERPLIGEEGNYILCKEDLITLKPGRENAWLDAFVEKMLQKIYCPPIRYLFCSAEIRDKADEITVLYDKKRINGLVTAIITTMIITLLIVPVYALWHVSQQIQTKQTTALTIGVLLIFTLFFSATLSFFTRAKRHEILGAAAAYCAVLVVFMANTSQSIYHET